MKLKQIQLVFQESLARHRNAALAIACGGMTIFGLVGLWSLALAQQPYPPPGYQQPYPQPGYQQHYPQPYQQPGYQQQGPAYQGQRLSSQELRCMQLEQELANDWVRRQQSLSDGPNIEKQIRKYDRIFQTNRARANRLGCYKSNFIFGRTLIRTPKCLRLNGIIEDARRQLTLLQEQRQARRGGRSRRQNDRIAALSRAGCGASYRQETRRRSSGGGFLSWLEEDFWDTTPRRGLETSRIEPFATYRTLCVRSCDGYYFPVSFSALPSRFSQDLQKCQSQCAAPAELYVYRNPGEEPEQMVSFDGIRAYSEHANAWRYRKQYVKGCSCKTAEYDPGEIAALNEKEEAERNQKSGAGGARFAGDKKKAKKTR